MVVPFWKSLAFWKSLSYVVAAVWYFLDPESAVADLVLLGLVQAVLQLFGVTPELRDKGLW